MDNSHVKVQAVYRPLDSLRPYDNSPRIYSAEDIDCMAASIKEFGQLAPIVVDRDGLIAAGEKRYAALKQLGLSEALCIPAEHLTDEQIRAYRLADNKQSEFYSIDEARLREEFEQITGIDMSLFGFSLDEAAEGVDIDAFFTDPVPPAEKAPSTIVCPHCGEEFEP